MVPDCPDLKGRKLFAPKDNIQKELWRDVIQYTGEVNSLASFRVCEHHFSDGQFSDPDTLLLGLPPRKRARFLKPDAVPDIMRTGKAPRLDNNLDVRTILIRISALLLYWVPHKLPQIYILQIT